MLGDGRILFTIGTDELAGSLLAIGFNVVSYSGDIAIVINGRQDGRLGFLRNDAHGRIDIATRLLV